VVASSLQGAVFDSSALWNVAMGRAIIFAAIASMAATWKSARRESKHDSVVFPTTGQKVLFAHRSYGRIPVSKTE
jgi:hypothetical protein